MDDIKDIISQYQNLNPPLKKAYSKTYYYKQGKVLEAYEEGAVVENVIDTPSYQQALIEYKAESNRLYDDFKNTLFSAYPNLSTDECEFLYAKAVESVTNTGVEKFDDMVDLYKDIIEFYNLKLKGK